MKAFFAIVLLASLPLYATDVEREQRWVDQTVDVIFDGEPVFLEADAHKFLSIYTQSEVASSKGEHLCQSR